MRNIFSVFLIMLVEVAFPQIQTGKWRDHFSYNYGNSVCLGDNKVYCATPTGIFWYNSEFGEIGKINRISGLTDINISSIEYSSTQQVLAVGYENGNIDFVFKNRILNLPQIKEKLLQGSKRINGFTFYNDIVYVSTDFGIVAINLSKEEIKDTYYIGNLGESIRVNRTTIFNEKIYAATEKGLLSANVNDPLLIHYLNWTSESGVFNLLSECVDIDVFGQSLVVIERNNSTQKDIIWSFDRPNWVKVAEPYNTITHVRANQTRFIVTSKEGISIYSSVLSAPEVFTSYNFTWLFQPEMAIPLSSNAIAIADNVSGLVYGQPGGFQEIRPNGPSNNRAFSIGVSSEKLVVTTGGYDAAFGNLWYPLSYHMFENEKWTTSEDWVNRDAIRVLFNPSDPQEFYISSWGSGIFRYSENSLLNHYNPTNSSLQSIYINDPYCRISGLAFDNKGNLWAANVMVPKPISVRKADGNWFSFPYASAINADRLSELSFSPSGLLWLVLPMGEGLFVLDPGNNIESATDDNYRKIKLTDRNGNLLPNDIHSLIFDREGYLWVGTNEGVVISYNPERALNISEFVAQRVKIPDVVAGLAAYLLQTETVTSIAVDGGNRKWFGTSKSGVFLQSSDGSVQILHFNMDNSPLPSNNITDIKLHPNSGEVFIATDKGVVSYRGDATEPGEKFGKVYAYPNPVKPDYNGVIVVTGLVENTTVKITDISGNLVYETKSNGGQATWDGKNLNGHRVATGVYLIFCSDSKGEQTAVSKLLFIR
ncbi:MAG: two-component regulator propeller domain-containing protein [Tenuifilaceae bacterium]